MKLGKLVDFNPVTKVRRGVQVPFIDMATLPTNGKYISKTSNRLFSGSGAKFTNGDTLVARITPCLENGKGAYVSELEENGFGSTEFIVLRAKNNSDNQFIYYLTRWSKFREYAIQGMSGTSGRQRVSWQTLSDFEFATINKQNRFLIGEVLSRLDDKIELNRQMNETLEQMAQAVFQDWFVDFEPVKRKLKGINDPVVILGGLITDPAKAQEIASLFPDQFAEDGLPERWGYSSLNEIAVKTGNQILPQEIDPETIYIGLGHIPRRSLAIYDWDQASKVTSNKLTFNKGDILFGKLRPYFHKVVIAPQNGISSTDIIPIQAIRNIYYSYLVCLVSSNKFVDYTDKSSTGTRMPRTSWAIMANYKIPKPSDAVFEAFNHITSKHFSLMQENVLQNRTLAEMRDLLLQKLMSGEISVDELEKKMGGVL